MSEGAAGAPQSDALMRAVARPFDLVRQQLFLLCTPWINPFIRSRSLRITTSACIFIMVAFAVSLSLPMWQLLLGPILLGIPHVIGDLRYLVVHNRLHKQPWFWLCIALPFAMYVVQHKPHYPMIAVLCAAILSQRTGKEKMWLVPACGGLLALAWLYPRHFLYGFLHAHNLVGIAMWWFWRRNRQWWEAIPLLLCGVCTATLFVFPWVTEFILMTHAPGLDMRYFARNLAGFVNLEWQIPLVVSYAFLQSMHYLVWIRLIPEEARKQPTPRSFHRSLVALVDDFGRWFVGLTLVGMVLLAIAAFYNPKQARYQYLYLIAFHGFLELAVLAYVKQLGVPSMQPAKRTSA